MHLREPRSSGLQHLCSAEYLEDLWGCDCSSMTTVVRISRNDDLLYKYPEGLFVNALHFPKLCALVVCKVDHAESLEQGVKVQYRYPKQTWAKRGLSL